MQLEELQPKHAIESVYPDGPVIVLSVQWYVSEAPELSYKTPLGATASDLLYQDDDDCLRILSDGRPWSFDGDGHRSAPPPNQEVSVSHNYSLCNGLAGAGLACFWRLALPAEQLGDGGCHQGCEAEAHQAAQNTRYAKVSNAEGNPITVREALAMITQILDEVLAEQEGDFDPDSRWALAWFDQFGFSEGEFGIAETLSKAKNTSVQGMVEAGVIVSRGGTVQLLKPSELPVDWDPDTDTRLTAWEAVHHLIRVLEGDGEEAAGVLAAKLGALAEISRELCYRLYTVCERKKRNEEARAYNGLVQSWPEIMRLSRLGKAPVQQTFDELE